MDEHVTAALEHFGLTAPSWKTLVLTARVEDDIPGSVLWQTWCRVDRWPEFGSLYRNANWISSGAMTVGARFEVEQNLGFPFGVVVSREQVGAVEPGRAVRWWARRRGVATYTSWVFDRFGPQRTAVIAVSVLHGVPVGLSRIFVARRWRRRLQQQVDGLVRAAARR